MLTYYIAAIEHYSQAYMYVSVVVNMSCNHCLRYVYKSFKQALYLVKKKNTVYNLIILHWWQGCKLHRRDGIFWENLWIWRDKGGLDSVHTDRVEKYLWLIALWMNRKEVHYTLSHTSSIIQSIIWALKF